MNKTASFPHIFSDISLHEAVTRGATIMCASAPLARHLLGRYGRIVAADGRSVWQTPDITAWAAWVRRQHDTLLDTGVATERVLSGAEEQLVWEDIISAWDAYGRLLQVEGAAVSAAQAARTCESHQIKRAALTRGRRPETSIFLEWQKQFEARLDQNRWRTGASLDAVIAAALEDGQLAPPETVVIAGFDRLSKVEAAVVTALERRGAELRTLGAAAEAEQAELTIARDLDQELDAVAQWILAYLERQPESRIAVAAANPAKIREGLDDRLRKAWGPAETQRYQFDLDASLAQKGAVFDALAWLRLVVKPCSRERVLHLLRSAAFRSADDQPVEGLKLELAVAQLPLRAFHFAAVMRQMQEQTADSPLVRRWLHVLAERDASSVRADLREWSSRFARWLRLAQWPGEYAQDAETRERFTEALGGLARLSHLHPECDGESALSRLQKLCEALPGARALDAQVQVVSIEDASCMRFDALWVAQLDDAQWPPVMSASSLLPLAAQRNAGVVRASPTGALAIAEAQTRRLRHSASELKLSYAKAEGESEQRPSPLLALLEPHVTEPSVTIDEEPATTADDTCEWLDDHAGHSIRSATENGVAAGGARLLADQSACPFRAYAVHRLTMTREDTPGLGLDRRDAGTLLHRALELTWEQLQTSSVLQSRSDAEIDQVVNAAVQRALAEQARRSGALQAERYRTVEAARLRRLIDGWLDYERKRTTPFAVLAQESAMLLDLGPFSVNVRVDRVDQAADGQLIVIDYKSGSVSTSGWSNDRLAEPQVPLYAVSQKQAVGAALLAQVRTSRKRFAGVTRNAEYVPRAGRSVESLDADAWAATVATWEQQLAELAGEIGDGLAVVAPSHGPGTCAYCHLRAACRIDESSS